MTQILKRITAFLLCLCLFLSCGCKEQKSPDKEAAVNSEATKPTIPQVVTDEVTAKEGSEAVLSAEELKYAYSYSFLSELEKKVYRKMLNMVRNLTVGWIDMGYIINNPTVAVAKAYRAMCNDFPQYYWMPVSYYVTMKDGTVAVAFKRNDAEDGYGFTKDELERNKEEVEDAIDRIVSKALKAENDFEKEVIIHDMLCKTVRYDSEFDDGNGSIYSIYGALINGHAVCEGYARAFKLLCQTAGLECILITGDSKGVGHLWNMVKLEGNWYHVDVTWDDLREEPHHTYLNLTTLQIRADHDIDLTYNDADISFISQGNTFNFSIPNADSTEHNYFIKRGLIIKDDPINPVAEEIVKKFKAGEKRAEFMFYDEQVAEDFKTNYEKYVVEIQNKCIEKTLILKFKLKTLSFPGDTCVIYFEKTKK